MKPFFLAKRYSGTNKKAAGFLNLQAAFCLKGGGLFNRRQKTFVIKVSPFNKHKPFFSVPGMGDNLVSC